MSLPIDALQVLSAVRAGGTKCKTQNTFLGHARNHTSGGKVTLRRQGARFQGSTYLVALPVRPTMASVADVVLGSENGTGHTPTNSSKVAVFSAHRYVRSSIFFNNTHCMELISHRGRRSCCHQLLDKL